MLSNRLLFWLLLVLILNACSGSTNHNGTSNEATKSQELTNASKSGREFNDYPTADEIQSTNAKLPIEVGEGTMWTKVEYNEATKVETFYYKFTQEVDESLISPENISILKRNMVAAYSNPQNASNAKRIKSGVTFVYVYKSINDKVLYKITIDSIDLK